MKKIITEKQLKEIIGNSISKILLESETLKSFEHNGHVLAVVDYDMSDENDSLYIKNNKEIIWNILESGYSKLGGFKGFRNVNDMLKKSPFYKIGYCDEEIVAVTVYNMYLGGSKCVGATCVKNDNHNDAVKLLKLILEHNITDFKRWIWIEASGKIEEMCKELGSFNVPSEYADIYLNGIPINIIDDYHYQRKIVGNLETKTIFGFKDKHIYQQIKEEQNGLISDFLKSIDEKNINENANKKFQRYASTQPQYYRDKCIVDYFVYLKDDEMVNEFTIESLNILKQAINNLKQYSTGNNLNNMDAKLINMTIEEGIRVIETSSVLLPLAV